MRLVIMRVGRVHSRANIATPESRNSRSLVKLAEYIKIVVLVKTKGGLHGCTL